MTGVFKLNLHTLHLTHSHNLTLLSNCTSLTLHWYHWLSNYTGYWLTLVHSSHLTLFSDSGVYVPYNDLILSQGCLKLNYLASIFFHDGGVWTQPAHSSSDTLTQLGTAFKLHFSDIALVPLIVQLRRVLFWSCPGCWSLSTMLSGSILGEIYTPVKTIVRSLRSPAHGEQNLGTTY